MRRGGGNAAAIDMNGYSKGKSRVKKSYTCVRQTIGMLKCFNLDMKLQTSNYYVMRV